MGKVIKYKNNTKQGRQVSPPDNSTSTPSTAALKAKRKEKSTDPIGTWSGADLDLHRQLLLKLMRDGEFAEAKIVAKHLTDLEPTDPYAWYLRGTALLELSDPKQAELCLLKSMEIQGTDGSDCYQMSRARLLQGDLEGTVDWCRRALELEPDKPSFHWLLIKVYAIQGDLAAAIDAGKEALTKMVERPDKVKTRLKLANLYISTSNLHKAETQLKAALKLDPSIAELWFTLGHCLSRQHKTDESLQAFQRAAEIDPHDPDTMYNIGDAYLGLGMPDKALKPLLQAVQFKHDFSLAHYDLSLAFFRLYKYREAETAARAALRDDPEMKFQRSNLGMGATENLGLALMNQGRMEEAEACFRRNLRLFAETCFNLGLTLFKTHRYEEALENFRRALELEPEDPEHHNLLGQTYEELGQPVEAERSLRRSIEINPNYAIGHYDLGVILAKLEGRRDEAFEAFQSALKIDPELIWAYYCIACLHAVAGEEGPALELLEKALQKGFREFDHMDKDPDWNGLRINPKFIRLLEKYRETKKRPNVTSLPGGRIGQINKHRG